MSYGVTLCMCCRWSHHPPLALNYCLKSNLQEEALRLNPPIPVILALLVFSAFPPFPTYVLCAPGRIVMPLKLGRFSPCHLPEPGRVAGSRRVLWCDGDKLFFLLNVTRAQIPTVKSTCHSVGRFQSTIHKVIHLYLGKEKAK